MKQINVTEADKGKRLDVFLTDRVGSVSRASINKLINQGKITVNKQKEKNGYKLKLDDTIAVDFDFEAAQIIPKIELPILYEDDDCIVINKPTGVLTHSKGAFNPEATVATFIAGKIKDMEGERAGIVHRLDRATSGVIICAKTPEALSWLQKQFSSRKVKKTYYAVIQGELDPPKAIVEVPVERNPHDPKTFRAGQSGKPAITAYDTMDEGNGYSLIKLDPQTGRTHQLRVHLKYLGHPIVGDPIYGGEEYPRLLLHAEKLELTLPNHERKVFESPLPSEFQAILKA